MHLRCTLQWERGIEIYIVYFIKFGQKLLHSFFMQPAVPDTTFFTNTHQRLSGHIIRFITVLYCLSNYYYSVLFSPFSIFFTVFFFFFFCFFNFCLPIFPRYSFAIFYPWKKFLVTRFLVTAFGSLLVTALLVLVTPWFIFYPTHVNLHTSKAKFETSHCVTQRCFWCNSESSSRSRQTFCISVSPVNV